MALSQNYFLYAVEENNLTTVLSYIEMGVDVNYRDEVDRTPLYVAVLAKHSRMVRILLENGANPNEKYQDKEYTLLHFAATFHLVEIGQLLIKAGADVNIRDAYGNNPLWTATFNARTNDGEFVQLLLENGANKNSLNNVGKTPYLLAVTWKIPSLIELFNNYN